MLSSRRVLPLLLSTCAVAAVVMPVVALAHGSGGGGRRSTRSLTRAERLCGELGVFVNGRSHGDYLVGARHTQLNETQVQELTSACQKLASAYAIQRTAEGAPLNAEHQALKAALIQLDGVCPAWPGHHGDGSGPTGATGS